MRYAACFPSSVGPKVRFFADVQAFDGYMSEVRKLGAAVTFVSPFAAQVAF